MSVCTDDVSACVSLGIFIPITNSNREFLYQNTLIIHTVCVPYVIIQVFQMFNVIHPYRPSCTCLCCICP